MRGLKFTMHIDIIDIKDKKMRPTYLISQKVEILLRQLFYDGDDINGHQSIAVDTHYNIPIINNEVSYQMFLSL